MSTVIGFTISITGSKEATAEAEALRRKIADVQSELKKASDVKDLERLGNELIDLKAKQSEVNKVIRDQVKAREDELRTARGADNTYEGLSRRLTVLRASYKDLAAAEQDTTDEAKELLREISKLDTKLKSIDASTGQFQRNVGNYGSAFDAISPRLSGFKNQISDIGNTLKLGGIGAAAGGIATVAVAAFSAASEAVQYLDNLTREYQKTLRETASLTGQQGQELIDTSASAKALADTFDVDVKESIVAANTLAKEFGVSFSESFEEIARGFANGANASGDFLDSISQYSTQYREAGFSAKGFIDLAIEAQRQGIYSDKGLDSVKEFGNRIREQTTATKTALEDAFGTEFTGELFGNLNSGAITTEQALGKVAAKMQDTTIPANKLQTIIADTFGGAGEDAGRRWIGVMAEVFNKTTDASESTNQYVKYQIDLYNANKDAETSAFELASAFSSTSVDLQIAKARGREFINEALFGIVRAAQLASINLKSFGAGVREFFKTGSLSKAGSASFKKFSDEILELADKEVAAKKIIDEQKAKQDQASQKNVVRRATETGKKSSEALVKGSIAELEKRKSEVAAAIANTLSGSEAQKKLLVQQKEIEALLIQAVEDRNAAIREIEIREELKTLKALEEIRTGVGLQPISDTRTGLELPEGFAKKSKTRATDNYKDRTDDYEYQLAREEAFQEGLRQLRAQGLQSAFELINLFSDRAAEKEKERFAAIVTAQEESITRLEEFAANAEGIQKKRLEAQIKSEQKILEQKRKDQEAAEAKAAKKSKARAVAQSIIEGAIATLKALNSFPFPPFSIPQAIAAGLFAATQTAVIAAQPLATGGKIKRLSGQRVNENPNIKPLSNGDSVVAVLTPGEVVLNRRQQRMLGGDRTFRRLGIPGFADGGLVAPNLQAVQAGINANGGVDITALVGTVLKAIDAVNSRIDRIQVILRTDDLDSDRQEAESLKQISIL